MAATVTKLSARRFAVEGVLAVIGGRIVNEAYVSIHTTKGAADRDAAALDRTNAEGLAFLATARKARRAAAEAYLAKRAERRERDAAQLAFAL